MPLSASTLENIVSGPVIEVENEEDHLADSRADNVAPIVGKCFRK